MNNATIGVGSYIKWEQLNGVKHKGVVFEMDSNMACVKCENHPEKKECICDNC